MGISGLVARAVDILSAWSVSPHDRAIADAPVQRAAPRSKCRVLALGALDRRRPASRRLRAPPATHGRCGVDARPRPRPARAEIRSRSGIVPKIHRQVTGMVGLVSPAECGTAPGTSA